MIVRQLIPTALLMLAIPAFASPASSPYFVQGGVVACRSLLTLTKIPSAWKNAPADHVADFSKHQCRWLAANSVVQWNGAPIGSYFAQIIPADDIPMVTYRNFLDAKPWRNPLSRDYVTAEGAIACPVWQKLAETREADAHRDQKWFRETGCYRVAAGVEAIRIYPNQPTSHIWQVRLRSGRLSQTVFMDVSNIRTTP
jgi:hypothetical protein